VAAGRIVEAFDELEDGDAGLAMRSEATTIDEARGVKTVCKREEGLEGLSGRWRGRSWLQVFLGYFSRVESRFANGIASVKHDNGHARVKAACKVAQSRKML
jgi:hypothetical protein